MHDKQHRCNELVQAQAMNINSVILTEEDVVHEHPPPKTKMKSKRDSDSRHDQENSLLIVLVYEPPPNSSVFLLLLMQIEPRLALRCASRWGPPFGESWWLRVRLFTEIAGSWYIMQVHYR